MNFEYKDYLRVVLIAYNEEINFYENCGFELNKAASAMSITYLWTQNGAVRKEK